MSEVQILPSSPPAVSRDIPDTSLGTSRTLGDLALVVLFGVDFQLAEVLAVL